MQKCNKGYRMKNCREERGRESRRKEENKRGVEIMFNFLNSTFQGLKIHVEFFSPELVSMEAHFLSVISRHGVCVCACVCVCSHVCSS